VTPALLNRIAGALTATGDYSDHDLVLFEKEVKSRQVKNAEILLNEGEVARSIYFLLEGAVYQHSIKADGLIQVLDLHADGEWFLNHQSFVTQTPSESNISAFADTWLLEISIESIHFLIGQSPSFLQLNKILAQSTSRVYFFDHSSTPLQKYEYLFRNKQLLLKRFPLKMIASYLKITPETLSRVRERFAKEPNRY
jgi:CRP-like cAMP-binding protein